MKKNSVLVFLLLIGLLCFFATTAFADATQNCGRNHSLVVQEGTNNQLSSNCNNNSNQNNNSNSQSQSQTQDNNQTVTISAPIVASVPTLQSLPSTGASPILYSLFGLIPLGIALRRFA